MIISSDYDGILRILKFCGENNYLPSMIFVKKILIQHCFWPELVESFTDFQNFAAHFRKIKGCMNFA